MSDDPAETAVEAKEEDRDGRARSSRFSRCCSRSSEAGAKRAQHLSTESNIEASDLFNFYQAKKIRSTVVETAAEMLEAQKTAVVDPKAQEAFEKQIEAFKETVAHFEHDPKKPEDSLEAIQERAQQAMETRELANHRLERYELGSGLTQIAIVLASAAIITEIGALIWISVGLGVVGAILMALGFFAPTALSFLG